MFRLILTVLMISLWGANSRQFIGDSNSRFLSEVSKFINKGENGDGTRWAVLMAGSRGWKNYRHQADVCHAYQILKKGGLNDENIVVMMYDDIAQNSNNPRPGVIINSPDGDDVYSGVPKDYTGEDVNAENFFNVVLGNKSAITGSGSGKVVDSGPNDYIFIYYVDHGSPLIISTPTDDITADELNRVLKQKYDSQTYKSMVFYLEACEAGSMFDGLLSAELNIYATTASNPDESSYGYYCPGSTPAPPSEYDTCLGDLYSISWMEDCDNNSTATETLDEQYQRVKDRTDSSHVMKYGDVSMGTEELSVYMGAQSSQDTYVDKLSSEPQSSSVNQRDADLLHLQEKYRRAPEGSQQKLEAQKQLSKAIKDRKNVDSTIETIGNLLFGSGKGLEVMKTVRPAGQPPVDDWDCFKTLLQTYEAKCGALSVYGRKHTRVFANFCNAGIRQEQMEKAATQACSTKV